MLYTLYMCFVVFYSSCSEHIKDNYLVVTGSIWLQQSLTEHDVELHTVFGIRIIIKDCRTKHKMEISLLTHFGIEIKNASNIFILFHTTFILE